MTQTTRRSLWRGGVFLVVLLSFSAFCRAESYISLLAGPSISPRQDIKKRTFDQNQHIVNRETLYSETSLRFKTAIKWTHYFRKALGIETEYWYGRDLTSVDTTGKSAPNERMEQDRHAFMFSFLFRGNGRVPDKTSYYLGMGAGGIYSDFGMIGNEWGYGGQIYSGLNFPFHDMFVEIKYIWALDVGDSIASPGDHLKTSGNPQYNLATHLFSPHNDTQIIGLMVGTRFKIRN